jgi:[acyl-carrier-protein] S-malonyltransferase
MDSQRFTHRRIITMSKIAFLFPGQGSQSVGMGQDLFQQKEAARQTFQEIDAIAGRPLSGLCFEGPETELKRTLNTQPTILAVSLAAWRAMQSLDLPSPAYVAGHSLGEFTALACAGVLSVESVVKLVIKRAQLMEDCPPGAMSAVLGLAPDTLQTLCRETTEEMSATGDVVIVANFNTNEQLVISGSPVAVTACGVKAKSAGGKVIPLPVGGAFHSPLMTAAAQEFEQELSRYEFKNASLEVVQNFDARPSSAADEIKGKLMKQMPSSVRWCESVEFMLSQGVTTFVEVGPGKALAGMVRKIDRTARVYNVFDVNTLEEAASALHQTAVV